MTIRSHIRNRRVAIWIPLFTLALSAVSLSGLPMLGSSAGASGTGQLHRLRCTKLHTDPLLEAPLYAQQEGASGGTDEWWCQLPHATEMPAHYVALQRTVADLTYPYALYTTYYGPQGSTPGTLNGSAAHPRILVTDDVNSTVVAPTNLEYPRTPVGKKVGVAKGTSGIESVNRHSVSVVWKYPSTGRPQYLRGVVTVTVSARGVSPAVALAVAKHVEPD